MRLGLAVLDSPLDRNLGFERRRQTTADDWADLRDPHAHRLRWPTGDFQLGDDVIWLRDNPIVGRVGSRLAIGPSQVPVGEPILVNCDRITIEPASHAWPDNGGKRRAVVYVRSPKLSANGRPATPVVSSTDTSSRLRRFRLSRTVGARNVSVRLALPVGRVFFPTTEQKALRRSLNLTRCVTVLRSVTGTSRQNGTRNSTSIGARDQSPLNRFESSWKTPRSQLMDADRG